MKRQRFRTVDVSIALTHPSANYRPLTPLDAYVVLKRSLTTYLYYIFNCSL